MTLKVYTAQYRYSGPHRLDITVKGKDPVGRVFAPNWDMVMKHKNNPNYGNKEYTEEFHGMMISSLDSRTDVWMEDVLKRGYVVLVCFCPAGAFCHRTLVADYLVQLGAQYMGEIDLNDKNFTLPLTPVTVDECFENKPITEFQKEYRWLSNFWQVPIPFEGITYKSNEHLYQSRKFGADNWLFMSTCKNPKTESKKADISDGWFERNKIDIMLVGLLLKFDNPTMKANLLGTGTRIIIEGNYWHDNFWGDCYCQKCKNIPGQNTLGKMIMEIRKGLNGSKPIPYYYVHHESECVWVSLDPGEAHGLVEEIDVHSFNGLIATGYTYTKEV